MFDRLVESTTQKNGRTGRYFGLALAVYIVALIALAIGTIMTFSPVLAEDFNLLSSLKPPTLTKNSEPPVQHHAEQPQLRRAFAPAPVPTTIPLAIEVPRDRIIYGPAQNQDPFGARGSEIGPPGPRGSNEGVTPPPPPTPKPAATPAPTPEKPQIQRVSGEVLQGKAIRREKPIYPVIARQVKIGGPVQIQIMISEEGRVMEATVISGPPLLQAAALDAARKWVFAPTTIGGAPVRVQGVLTFNFTME